jgi:hypothetical protein
MKRVNNINYDIGTKVFFVHKGVPYNGHIVDNNVSSYYVIDKDTMLDRVMDEGNQNCMVARNLVDDKCPFMLPEYPTIEDLEYIKQIYDQCLTDKYDMDSLDFDKFYKMIGDHFN